MAYSDFTLLELKRRFGVTEVVAPLFATKPTPVQPDAQLIHHLERVQTFSMRNEKAKSEAVVFPVLWDVVKRNEDFFTLFSGENLSARKEEGLSGECDFVVTKNLRSYEMEMPILCVVKAKRDNFDIGIPQCAAQLLGASLLNQEINRPIDPLYGCVTTADYWRFLRLEGRHFTIDEKPYALSDLPQLLGVFQHILDFYREMLTAQGYKAEEPVGNYWSYRSPHRPNIPVPSPVFQ